jgi:hypothetical protein
MANGTRDDWPAKRDYDGLVPWISCYVKAREFVSKSDTSHVPVFTTLLVGGNMGALHKSWDPPPLVKISNQEAYEGESARQSDVVRISVASK